MDAVPWSELEGGREAIDALFAEVDDAVQAMQRRFAAVLDALGPPGMVSWDPIGGTVTLRGRTFQAQQLGSFDGYSWLWSWANTHLDIPDELTAYARGLRDKLGDRSEAFRTPMIADSDEALAQRLGAIALGHGFGEAMYYANQSQLYLIAPGQLDGIEVPEAEPDLERRATCFATGAHTFADVIAHLRADPKIAELVLEEHTAGFATVTGDGYALHLSWWDDADEIRDEVDDLATDDLPLDDATAVLTIDGLLDEDYADTLYVATPFGGWAPAELGGTGEVVPWQLLAVCERLNTLDGFVVHDTVLGTFYPR